MTLTIGQGKLVAEGSTSILVTQISTGITTTVPIASSNGSNIPDPTTNQLIRISADDYETNYATKGYATPDAYLRADMWADDPGSFATGHKGYYDTPALVPTGLTNAVRFPYFTFGDLITLDATNTWRGKATFRQRFPNGQQIVAQTLNYYLSGDGVGNKESIWMKQVFRIDPTGTGGQPFFYGTTPPGGTGYKQNAITFGNYNGRYETEWENGSTTSAQLGTTSRPTDGGGANVGNQSWDSVDQTTWMNGPIETAPFTDSKWYALIAYIEKIDANTQRIAWWYGPDDGSGPMVKQYDITHTLKLAYQGTVGLYMGLPQINGSYAFGSICNKFRSNPNDVYINRGDTVFFDPAVVADPWSVLNTHGVTISSVSPATLARGASAQTVTITGTNIDPNCTAVFSNAGITSTPDFSYGKSSRTQLVLSVSVASGATPGAGTVQVTSTEEPSSGTLAFTVT